MYTYQNIQGMRDKLIIEIKLIFPTITAEVLQIVEMRLQTAIMAGLLEQDI